ncbi:NAD(P)/FAD-dependent oxidoreductase [Kosakonia sp. S57]|uniref:NAD(P)/FAD-dependent oxidoreductase n=1 Tax=unclassified Kosakonia TaxID=2632876 RepID=UPI00351CAA33
MTRKKRIIVVGAGITGASIAWHLAHLDFEVTIVEQDMPASGATANAFGWLTAIVKNDAPDVLLRRAALTDWHRLEEKIPELQINWSGSLSYGETSGVFMEDETLLHRADIARLEPALVNPPNKPAMLQKMVLSMRLRRRVFWSIKHVREEQCCRPKQPFQVFAWLKVK